MKLRCHYFKTLSSLRHFHYLCKSKLKTGLYIKPFAFSGKKCFENVSDIFIAVLSLKNSFKNRWHLPYLQTWQIAIHLLQINLMLKGPVKLPRMF